MGWSKREVSANLVILGDAEGNVKSVGGLLAGVSPDPRYPDNRRYELVQKDGTSKSLAGSASINSQLGIGDVGKFVKLSFTGWGHSSNGRFKEISVEVWEDAVTDEMKKWPRWAEFQNGIKLKPKAAAEDAPLPEQAPDEDDDLPFDRGASRTLAGPKRCFKCGEVKSRTEFYRHPQMGDGLLGKCKVCTRRDVQENRQAKHDYYVEYDRDRSRTPERRAALKVSQTKHQDHERARFHVHNAVARGKLEKKPCEVCGAARVDAHHPDYTKPLEVRWLCRKHHMELHRMEAA